jgi:hypothetical protein
MAHSGNITYAISTACEPRCPVFLFKPIGIVMASFPMHKTLGMPGIFSQAYRVY